MIKIKKNQIENVGLDEENESKKLKKRHHRFLVAL